jgi:hypothetical protein
MQSKPCEWDFSQIPKDEIEACCLYEYARESQSIVDYYDHRDSFLSSSLMPKWHESREFLHHRLIFSLPPRFPGQPYFDCGWQEKPDAWRAIAKQLFAIYSKGWKTNPHEQHADKKGFTIGISPQFDSQLLKGEYPARVLDPKTGLEVLIAMLDWNSFDDAEILNAFEQWVKANRPNGVGKHDRKGRPPKYINSLKRLGLLRLRHFFPFDDISNKAPVIWADEDKFLQPQECNRECMLTERDLHSYFPFLPKGEKPMSWKRWVPGL